MTDPTRVVGVCHAIRDFTFVMRDDELARARANGLVGSGVTFLSEERFEQAKRQLQAQHARHERVDAGGPVSNTLYAMGARLPAYPRPFSLVWTGPYTTDITYLRGDPLASLRTVGVAVEATTGLGQSLLESICIVSRETGEAEAVLVGPRPDASRLPPEFVKGDLVLVQLAHLAELVQCAPPGGLPALAILTADFKQMDARTLKAVVSLAKRSQVRYAFGKLDEFAALGLIDGDTPHPALLDTEVIATQADKPVWLSPAGEASFTSLPVAPITGRSGVSFIGAGDAYAGGYLCARLLGEDVNAAHEAGSSEARLASYSPSARRSYSANLTELFGPHIERHSETPDWGLHARIRQTAGLTLLSCGTTGIDELALETAERWGLASFAVTKARGPKQENDPDRGEIANAHHIELGSPSNRYCTWANVFLADGTILLDYSGTEGSDETRKACATLNRPILELADVQMCDLDDMVRSWTGRHAIRVVHVGGNRALNLPDARREDAKQKVERALVAAATLLGTNTAIREAREPRGRVGMNRPARVGFPRLAEVQSSVSRYVDPQRKRGLTLDSLFFEYGEVQLCFGRSLDLVSMVDRGVLDYAFVGLDMVNEVGEGNFVVREVLGVFNTVLAVVAPYAPEFAPRRIVAQYPRAAARHFAREGAEVVPIVGVAETWVRTGEFDGAVDTWRTGRTAEDSGLSFVDAIASTSLAVVEGAAPPSAARRFVDGFVEWIRSASHGT